MVKQFFKDSAFDAVRLVVAVVAYMQIAPRMEVLVAPLPHVVGDGLATIVAAVLTVLAFWLIVPWSTIEIIFGRVDTGAAVPNTTVEIEASENQPLVARYDVSVRHRHHGAIGWAIARSAATKNPVVEVIVLNSKLVFTGDQPECRGTDRGFEIHLGELPRTGDWADPSVSIGTGAISNNASLGVSSNLRVTSRAAWLVRFFVLTSTNVKHIRIRKTS